MSNSTAQRRLRLMTFVLGSAMMIWASADDSSVLVNPDLQPTLEIVPPSFDAAARLQFEPSSGTEVGREELLQQRFPNGAIHIERNVTEDVTGNLVNHGSYKEYDTKGTLIRTGTYHFGKKEGKWSQLVNAESVRSLVETVDKGLQAPFTSEATFINDKIDGQWSISDAQGRPVILWQFSDGVRENVSTWFDSRGTATLEINYVSGVPHGPANITPRGKKQAEDVVFEQGRVLRTRTEWYGGASKTKKKAEETLLVPAGHTVANHSCWNSTLEVLPLDTQAVVRHGIATTWFSNGQKSMQGTYRLGAPDGDFQWWYSNGQPQGAGNYLAGAMNGRWVWWHTNGMKQMEGIYIQDAREGIWSSWDVNGKIVFRGTANELQGQGGAGGIASDGEEEDQFGQTEGGTPDAMRSA